MKTRISIAKSKKHVVKTKISGREIKKPGCENKDQRLRNQQNRLWKQKISCCEIKNRGGENKNQRLRNQKQRWWKHTPAVAKSHTNCCEVTRELFINHTRIVAKSLANCSEVQAMVLMRLWVMLLCPIPCKKNNSASSYEFLFLFFIGYRANKQHLYSRQDRKTKARCREATSKRIAKVSEHNPSNANITKRTHDNYCYQSSARQIKNRQTETR